MAKEAIEISDVEFLLKESTHLQSNFDIINNMIRESSLHFDTLVERFKELENGLRNKEGADYEDMNCVMEEINDRLDEVADYTFIQSNYTYHKCDGGMYE